MGAPDARRPSGVVVRLEVLRVDERPAEALDELVDVVVGRAGELGITRSESVKLRSSSVGPSGRTMMVGMAISQWVGKGRHYIVHLFSGLL